VKHIDQIDIVQRLALINASKSFPTRFAMVALMTMIQPILSTRIALAPGTDSFLFHV
jgi:hypothetical protein